MRRLVLAVAVLTVLCGRAMHAQQALGPVDWIFLVDTSKSMRGVGGAKNIWIDVKASLDSFVREAGSGDTVTMYGFDRDVRAIKTASPGDLDRAILALEANGNRTHLGAAIAEGLVRAEQLRRASGDDTRRQVVVLFTDGKEDVRGIANPVRIDSNLDRVGSTFVYFVSMGDHEPQLDAFAANSERTTVLKAPTAEAIRNIAREIRGHIPPPAPRPALRRVVPVAPPKIEKRSTAAKAAAALALLAAMVFLGIRQQRGRRRLEGELEILRPRAAPDAAFIGLPNLQAKEIALSAILPSEALAGSDARLFVRRTKGRNKVWIAAQSGSLRINDVETPLGALYDADTIDIGEARVRFNRVGDERPLESNQEADL